MGGIAHKPLLSHSRLDYGLATDGLPSWRPMRIGKLTRSKVIILVGRKYDVLVRRVGLWGV